MNYFIKSAGVSIITFVYYIGKEGRVIDEELLIQQIRAGDESAFRKLVQTYGSYVYRAVYSVLRDPKEAEDAAQETFIRVYEALPSYNSQGFKTWLTRIAINKAIDLKRKRERLREETIEQQVELIELHSSVDDGLNHVLTKERKQTLREKVAELPERHREMITAYYLEEKSYEQIATEHNIALKTVESKLYRARIWIREHWKEEEWG